MKLNREVDQQMENYLKRIEKSIKAGFGDPKNPLLVSVRSGSKFSMPGMMDTILNLGLNDKSIEGLSEKTGNPRFAWDAYRRFIQMFSHIVLKVDKEEFEKILERTKRKHRVKQDVELKDVALKEGGTKSKKLV